MSYVPLEDSPQVRLGKNYVLKEHVKNYPENIPCKPTLARYSLAFLEDWIEGEAEIDMECKEGNMHLEGRHFQILEFTVNGDKDYVYDGSRIFFKVVDGENRVGIRYRANFTGAFRKINMGHSEIASTGEPLQSEVSALQSEVSVISLRQPIITMLGHVKLLFLIRLEVQRSSSEKLRA